MKAVIVGFLVIMISVLLFGCCTMNINDEALAYMEQKYGERFEYSQSYGDSMSGTYELLATCESFPDQKILVQIENYRKRFGRVFRDNYIAVKYRQETIDFIQDCTVEVFGEANIHYNVRSNVLSCDLSENATFYEYLADMRVPLSFTIRIKASSFTSEEQITKLAESLSEYGTHYIAIIAMITDEQFNIIDENVPNSQLVLIRRVQLTRLGDISKTYWFGGE